MRLYPESRPAGATLPSSFLACPQVREGHTGGLPAGATAEVKGGDGRDQRQRSWGSYSPGQNQLGSREEKVVDCRTALRHDT